jgi:putative PEP-CTERM system histidine kinase
VLARAGAGLRYLALPFGRYLAILLAFAAGAGLLLTLLSQRLRRKWKVVISKHFFSHKHDYRQTWLNLTGRLGSCRTRSEMEDAILHIYEQIFGLGGASLYIADARSGRFVPSGHPLSTAFTASRNLLFYFRDRNRIWDPRDGEYVPGGEEADFLETVRPRLVVPLICNQRVEGLLVFKTGPADERFTYDDYDLMKTIAQQCALLLANMRLSEELVETGELAAMARVSSFVVHDLKNLTQTLSLTIDNAEEHMGNRAFQEDLMITIRHTVGNMKRLTQKLKIVPGSGRPGACADLRTLCLEILEEFAKTLPEASLIWRGEPVSCSVAPDELRRVIVNLVQNGLDSAGASGTIIVETGLYDGLVFLKVSDNGPGMSREFMQYQLFRAFRSTKHAGLGIGLYQCRQMVESWGGTIEASSDEGKGACFTVRLPAMVHTLVSVA